MGTSPAKRSTPAESGSGVRVEEMVRREERRVRVMNGYSQFEINLFLLCLYQIHLGDTHKNKNGNWGWDKLCDRICHKLHVGQQLRGSIRMMICCEPDDRRSMTSKLLVYRLHS